MQLKKEQRANIEPGMLESRIRYNGWRNRRKGMQQSDSDSCRLINDKNSCQNAMLTLPQVAP
jgi:hypothetical protein